MGIWVKRAGIFALMAVAVYLRFDGLDNQNYWYDEAITSLRVAGHTERQVAEYAQSHATFAMGELEQFVAVNGSTGFGDTVRSLASEDPQHAPLYYLLARVWAKVMGHGVTAGRGLAALASLLALPAMYWLCWELFVGSGAFRSRLVCWMGVAAMALSPFQIAMAREHREYSLFTLTFTLACASFLRALRKQNPAAWGLFALVMTASIYTSLLSILGLAACGVFLLLRERFRLNRTMLSFGAAAVACGIATSPWLMVLVWRRPAAQSGLGWVQSFSQGRWLLGFSINPVWRLADLSVWDSVQLAGGSLPSQWLLPLVPMLLLAAIWSFGRKSCAGFVTALICSVSGTIFLIDFSSGTTIGWAYRYGVPSNLGWVLAVAMLLAMLVEATGRWKGLGLAGVAVYLGVAGMGAYWTAQSRHNWNKAYDESWEAAEALNADPRAVLVSDDFVGAMLALGPQTRADLPVSWHARCFSCRMGLEPMLDIPDVPGGRGYYFRTWVNVPAKTVSAVVRRVAEDGLGDPRFHTELVQMGEGVFNLFLVRGK